MLKSLPKVKVESSQNYPWKSFKLPVSIRHYLPICSIKAVFPVVIKDITDLFTNHQVKRKVTLNLGAML